MITSKEIVKDISCDIISRGLSNGAQIPSIPQLCQKYKASNKTIQRALGKLKDEDILFSQPGKGIFIKDTAKIHNRTVTLKIAVLDSLSEKIINDIKRDFEKSSGSVKIVAKTFYPMAGIDNLISDFSPDIVIFEEANEYEFMRRDIWQKLDALKFIGNTYNPLLYGCRFRDELFAVPIFFSPVAVVYNKKIVTDAGIVMPERWDMSTFVKIAEKLTRKNISQKTFGFVLSLSLHRFPALITAFGGSLHDLSSSTLSLKRSLDFSLDLIDRNISPYIPESEAENASRFCFAEGYGAMRLESLLGVKHRHLFPFEIDFMPLPKIDTGGSSCFLVSFAGILKNAENKIWAEKFINHLFSEKAQTIIKQKHQLLPARKDICEDQSIKFPDSFPENHQVFMMERQRMQSTCLLFKPEIKKIISEESFLFFNKIKSSESVCETIKSKLMAE